MTARQVASILSDVETYLEINGADDFKTKAYGRAVRALETTTVDIEEAAASGKLTSIPGIGKTMAAEVKEIVETGECATLVELRASTPPGLIDITRIRGVGGKKVRALHQAIGITSLDELAAACREGRVASIAGFGAKSQENILAGITELKKNEGRFRLDTAMMLADALLPALRALPNVGRAEMTGDVRRGAEEFDHVAFVVESSDADAFAASVANVLAEIAVVDGIVHGIADDRFPVRIHTASAEEFVHRLFTTTGSTDHVQMLSVPLALKGYEFRSDVVVREGVAVELSNEDDLFALAGMPVVAPELREGIDELQRAIDGALGDLVEQKDMRGVLHVHSTWSDGKHSIADIAEYSRSLGYSYLLMCDHSKLAFYANGLDEFRLEQQGKEIDEINKRYDPATFRVLKGIECDIKDDGSLDLADDALAALDAVVVSVHSRFDMGIEQQTARLCRALENRYATILGHATGRLILTRKGYEVDLDQVIDAAVRYRRSIEINGNARRLDLAWPFARKARDLGVPIAINPDAHSFEDFANVRYGLVMARKAGLHAGDVVNTMSADEFLAWAKGLRD